MKSASQMSLEIRRKKKAMQSQEVNQLNPDDIELDSEEDAADMSAHGELMADSEDRAHEQMAKNPREVMMAKGGEVVNHERGINRPMANPRSKEDLGISEAGHMHDHFMSGSERAKKYHEHVVLPEMRAMKKPNLPMAEGGEVDDEKDMDDSAQRRKDRLSKMMRSR